MTASIQGFGVVERRLRRFVIFTVLVVAVVFVPVAALVAVSFHDHHVHSDHFRVVEERVERIECSIGLDPGYDTSEAGPFLGTHERATCPYEPDEFTP